MQLALGFVCFAVQIFLQRAGAIEADKVVAEDIRKRDAAPAAQFMLRRRDNDQPIGMKWMDCQYLVVDSPSHYADVAIAVGNDPNDIVRQSLLQM